jgi:ATP-binding cassette subfamily B multidrug efflux pump
MTQQHTNSFNFLYKYIYRYRRQMIAGILYSVLGTVFQLLIPWILRYGIDFLGPQGNATSNSVISATLRNLGHSGISAYTILLILAGTIIVSTVIQGIFRYLLRDVVIGVSRKLEYEMRNDFYRHLQKLSLSFYHRNKTGDLMALATNDLEAIRSMLGPGIMHLATTLLISIAAIVLMCNISLSLTLWSLLPLPLIALIVYRLVAKIDALFERIQAQFAAVTAKVQENLSGIRVIKSYVQEEHEIGTFSQQNRELVRRNLALTKVRASLWASVELLIGLGIVIVLGVGGKKVIAEQLSIGSLVAFLAYLAMLAWPMIALGWVLNLWQQGLASTSRVMAIFQEKPEIANSAVTNHAIRDIRGLIEFRNLSFRYNNDGPAVLQSINLEIPQGATVAIVGATGSGKTTLINLIPRMLEASNGSLLIDGQDIRTIPIEILRKNIGYVPQETFLFSDTLEENIAFGLTYHSLPEIEDATEVSQIKLDFDQFPDGLKTMVGERGITLSGGQKQRTAISRAVVRKPKILILDDSLSSVDTYTEEEILKRLKQIMRDRTSLIVSHRVSTVRDADFIVVLKDGKVVEQGTHDKLLDQEGEYYRLYQRQLLETSLAEL